MRLAAAIPLAAALAAALAACASTPPPLPGGVQSVKAPAVAPSVAAVASEVSVVGAAGPLNHGERQQVIKDVAAQGSAEAIKRQLTAMSSFGEVGLYSGNDARLLIDGPATFKAMFAAIEKARRTILLETYIIEDAAISRQLAALLAKKRAEGVAVLVIYDSVGSIGTRDTFFEALRGADVAICAFNPLNPLKNKGELDMTHRDHRKILTVDREVGFTGGINISAAYSSGSFGRTKKRPPKDANGKDEGWRDTQIELRGPAVAALDDLVRETWQQQKCEGALPELQKAPPKPAGRQLMRIVPSSPDDQVNQIYALTMSAIAAARRSVLLTMAYFAPGNEMVDALCEAAQRGVDVQLILPSRSDFSPVLHAGRSHYDRMLAAGVKIHELQDSVLHAKTIVVDGVMSTVGSANLDSRSFNGNNEVNAVVVGEDFGDAMTRMFRRDLADSKPITLEDWRGRSAWQRSKEFFARMFERLW